MTPPPRACYAGPIVVILVQRATPSPLGKAQPSMLKEAGVAVLLRQHMVSKIARALARSHKLFDNIFL